MPETQAQLRKRDGITPGIKLVDVRQLSTATGDSVRTIWRKVASGELPKPFMWGNRAVWRQTTIAKLFENAEAKVG